VRSFGRTNWARGQPLFDLAINRMEPVLANRRPGGADLIEPRQAVAAFAVLSCCTAGSTKSGAESASLSTAHRLVETGPTLYLPHSQNYGPGYLAFDRPDFTAHSSPAVCPSPRAIPPASSRRCSTVPAGTGKPTYADSQPDPGVLSTSAAEAVDVTRSLAPCSRYWPRGVPLVPASPDSKHDRSIRRGMRLPSQPRPRPRPSTDLPHSQAELVWQALREGWGLATFGRALADYAARRQSEV
jgi:hypothetical protein